MISSMTGFARNTKESQGDSFTWELRSVNHRYLELSIRLPEKLRELEKGVRERFQVVRRGKVEATLRVQLGKESEFDLALNEGLVRQLGDAHQAVVEAFPGAAVNTMDVLAWPGVLEMREAKRATAAEEVLALLTATLDDFLTMRCDEGGRLIAHIKDCLESIEAELAVIKDRLPSVLEAIREKVMARFGELALEVDQTRLEQEMVWLVQKLDIAEELQRLESHVSEVYRILDEGGVVGRRLDFLMQELNREANTIGSKSADVVITRAAVELKVLIEQIREQVQNIE